MSRTINKTTLIELVRAQPALWDRNSKGYHDRDLKPAMWVHIGEKLKANPAVVKKAWENIRDTFRKKLRAEARLSLTGDGSPGTAENAESKLPYYFEMLDFLRDYATRPHWKKDKNQECAKMLSIDSSSMNNQEDGDDYEMTDYIQFYDEDYDDPLQNSLQADHLIALKKECVAGGDSMASNSTEAEHLSSPCSSDNRTRGKRKKSDTEEQHFLEPEVKMRLAEDPGKSRKSLHDDDDYHFLISLLGPMKELDTLQKMRARMGMLECVTKELEKNRKHDHSKPGSPS